MCSVLVARQPELDYLENCLGRVRRAQAIGVLVAGEAGVGKTALLNRFANRAGEHGLTVCRADLGDRQTAGPLDMWRVAIRSWIMEAERMGHAPEVSALVNEPWQALAGLAPDLFARYGWRDRAACNRRSDPRIDGIERILKEEIMLFIAKASNRLPSVLMVDNLHSADRDSLSLLGELSPNVIQLPAMFLATFRPEALDRNHPLQRIMPTLRGPGDMHVLSLGPLTISGVAEYMRSLGVDREIELAEAVHGISGGNPLFLRQMSCPQMSSFQTGAFQTGAPQMSGNPEREHFAEFIRSIEESGVDQSLEERLTTIIDRRLDKLDSLNARYQRVVATAALIGPDLSVEALSRIALVTTEDARNSINYALEAGVLSSRRLQDGTFRFRHPFLERALLSRLGDAERARAHRRAADYLLSNSRDDDVAILRRIADHYLLTNDREAILTGMTHLLNAATRALAAGAWQEAVNTADYVEHSFSSSLPAARRADVHLLTALGHLYLGDKPAASGRLEQALKDLSGVPDTELPLDMLLRPEIMDLWSHQYPQLLDRLLPSLEDAHQEESSPQERVTTESISYSPSRNANIRIRSSSRHAQVEREVRARSRLQEANIRIFSMPSVHSDILRFGEEALELAETSGNSFLVAEAHHVLFRLALRDCDFDTARDHSDVGLEAYPVHDPLLHGRVQLERLNGEGVIAERYLERLRRNAGGVHKGPAISRVLYAAALQASGILGENGLDYLKESAALCRELLADPETPGILARQTFLTVCISRAYLGPQEAGSGMYERLAYVQSPPMISPGHLERIRMLMAAASGLDELTKTHFARARSWFRRLHDLPGEILTMIEAADILHGGGMIGVSRVQTTGATVRLARTLTREAAALACGTGLIALDDMAARQVQGWREDASSPAMDRPQDSGPISAQFEGASGTQHA